MKWGKKKWSSHPSLIINHVFPISWLTKLKPNKGICSEEMPVRSKQQDFVLGSSSKCSLLAEEGCFYSVDDDPYWRLSFEKETEEKSKNALNSAWKDERYGKMKDMQHEDEAIRRKRVNEEEYKAKTRRNSTTLKEKQLEDIRKRRSFSFPNCTFTSIEHDCLLEVMNFDELERLEDIKVKRMLSKQENCQKKKRYHKRRTNAKIECKIKGLEDKKRKKKTTDKNMVFDSYAVVKNSFDPKTDFRESMIEMIVVKGIERPEELEKLLACYLTLNCDEYHEIIIKVFREVWFELNEVYHMSKPHNPKCYDHDHFFS